MKKTSYILFLFVGFCGVNPQAILLNENVGNPAAALPGFDSPSGLFGPLLENMMESASPLMPIDPSQVKTNTKVQKKGNVTIKETNRTGPNFYMQEVVVNGGGSSAGGSLKELEKLSPFLLRGEPMFWNLKKKNNCKNCKSSQFCLDGACVAKKPAGSTCLADKECKKDLMCVFGVCNEADHGDAGTQCKKHDNCVEDLCCFSTKDSEKKECSARLPKGAICDQNPFTNFRHFLPFPFRKKRSPQKQCSSQCQDDLKCASNGDDLEKRCVSKGFKFTAVENPSNPINDDASSNSAEGSANDEDDDDSDNENDEDDDDIGKIKVTTADGEEIPDDKNKQKTTDNKKGGKKNHKTIKTKKSKQKKDDKEMKKGDKKYIKF